MVPTCHRKRPWALLYVLHRHFPLRPSGPSRGRAPRPRLHLACLVPARHLSARHGGREQVNLKPFHRSCHPTLLEHAVCLNDVKIDMTDADRPDTRVRLRNHNFCVLSTGSFWTCAGSTEHAMHRLCPLQLVVCFEKASFFGSSQVQWS